MFVGALSLRERERERARARARQRERKRKRDRETDREERECVWAEVDFVRGKGLTYTRTHPEKKSPVHCHLPFIFLNEYCFFFLSFVGGKYPNWTEPMVRI